MSGGSNPFDWAGDFMSQTVYDAGLRTGEGTRSENPRGREERKAKRKAERAKQEARKRLKTIPDPEAEKVAQRRKSARLRAGRKGRAGTMLSDQSDTLG